MSVTRGREAAFFFSNYRIRVLRFLYGTLLSAYNIRALFIEFFKNKTFVLMTFYNVQKLTVFTVHKLLVEMASLIGLPFVLA